MTKQSWPPWREAGAGPFLGRSPDERRQALIKLAWISVWMLYLGSPISDLLDRHHALPAAICGWAGLVVFVTGYLSVALFRTNQLRQPGRVLASLAFLATLSVVLSLTFGEAWLVLFVYTAVAFGAALPPRQARWAITACAGVLAGAGALVHADNDLMPGLLIPCLLSGLAMSGVRQLVFTMRELREARETIAHFAATEERLRLARDLHDLLGHSLSLITLKSELAGRMLPDRLDDAAVQVADIERVSRQALVDVREAVSGYRRPTFAVELAGARTALHAAGIHADLEHALDPLPATLAPDEESALAWAVREAVTNVVRHSHATRCTIALTEDAENACLTVSDNGRGPDPSSGLGNGLTGLDERLVLAGGRLRVTPGPGSGFALRAYVPLRAARSYSAGAE
ncbi:sensor histidine kinase [Actinacidiphila oryziradicis]|uniref:sensor histidine kinase n=1 Tax=Actinacidiphila oryziradicis TaxID=2571141 RepID=UPI001FE344AF|nr:sensor histidine kinase [Actinacidiphila oryziradicis]